MKDLIPLGALSYLSQIYTEQETQNVGCLGSKC